MIGGRYEFGIAAFCVLIATAVTAHAQADDYPTKPPRLARRRMWTRASSPMA
jgi:hypothetical protein